MNLFQVEQKLEQATNYGELQKFLEEKEKLKVSREQLYETLLLEEE